MYQRRPVVKVSLIRVIPRIEAKQVADFPLTRADLARAITQAEEHPAEDHVPEAHIVRIGLTLDDGTALFIDLSDERGKLHVALNDT